MDIENVKPLYLIDCNKTTRLSKLKFDSQNGNVIDNKLDSYSEVDEGPSEE
jgi:hypothetical protein